MSDDFAKMRQITQNTLIQYIQLLAGQSEDTLFLPSLQRESRPSVLAYKLGSQYLRLWIDIVDPADRGEFVYNMPQEILPAFEQCVNYMIQSTIVTYLDLVGGYTPVDSLIRSYHLEFDETTLGFVPVFKTAKRRELEIKRYEREQIETSLGGGSEKFTDADILKMQQALAQYNEDIAALEREWDEEAAAAEETQHNEALSDAPTLHIFCDLVAELDDSINAPAQV